METTGKYPLIDMPTEIAAKVYNARSLEPVKDGEFHSICKPPPDIIIQQEALDVTGIKREDIEKAPLLEVVWLQFVDWVLKFNPKKNKWDAPIAVGHNIKGFDIPIANRCCERFCKKKGETILFNTFKMVDSLDILFLWFENSNELVNMKMDTVRPYFGLSNDGGHRALADVKATGDLVMRFLKYHRKLMGQNPQKFKGAFAK